jgi:hypothetical protein
MTFTPFPIPAEQKGRAGSGLSAAHSSWRARMPLLFASLVFVLAGLASACVFSGCCIVKHPPIRSDGYGYYAYLPAVFIDHDLTMKTALAYRWTVVGNHPLPYAWTGIEKYPETGRLLDKYTSGTALLQAPFFIVAHTVARALGLPPYSTPYQAANILSGLTFFAVAIYLLLRMLMAQFPLRISLPSAAAIVFATNVFHFATYAGSFSQVYSFFLLAALLTIARPYRADRNASPAWIASLGMGAIVGLIALTRVPNIIAGIIPLALVCERYWSTRSAQTLLLEILAGVSAFLVVFSPQLAYWHAVTGHFLVNSYQWEGFNWLHPQVLNFLFSLKKGLFVWAPVLIVAVLGFPLFITADRVLALATVVVLALEVYVYASWWSWWFGNPFGSRPFVDMMPLVALPLAYGFEWLEARVWRFAPVLLLAIAIPLNLYLMVSYWYETLPSNVTSVADLTSLPAEWKTRALLLPKIRESLQLDRFYQLGTPFLAVADAPAGMWMEGFEAERKTAVWTVGREASLSIRLLLARPCDLRLAITLGTNGALLTPQHPRQRVIVTVAGETIGTLEIRWHETNLQRTLVIPQRLVRSGKILRIDFDLPDAVAPKQLGINNDPRLLGLYVSRLAIDRARPDR